MPSKDGKDGKDEHGLTRTDTGSKDGKDGKDGKGRKDEHGLTRTNKDDNNNGAHWAI
jgi:hypothetical protein